MLSKNANAFGKTLTANPHHGNLAELGRVDIAQKFFTPGPNLKKNTGDGLASLLADKNADARGKENLSKAR